ncbi:hypothetical protein FDP41_005338 [Naegleria fowleri]|uniref:Uncharacterized protein n=1 Tax=Naegleria fowleri TaxID=5763 RepID=A0A6A5BMQ7_NAEFO|nr:uncharacterized protein FDP41_005338 [Naegleria fowleri]KAF0975344.1 hypothetical protein FDP41_005338 [Naegleria fowleri]
MLSFNRGFSLLVNGKPVNLGGGSGSANSQPYAGKRPSFRNICNPLGNVYFIMVLSIVIWIIILSQIVCEFFVYPDGDVFVKIMPRAFIYPILLVCLIFYIPTVFMSPTYSYLTNFNVNQKIQEIVQKTIRDTPIIELHVSCYHYETRTQTTTDANGRLKTESRSVRVTTHTDSKQMPFEFHRDFSPPFAIKQTAKTFIKLDMDQKVFVTNEESKKILDEERVAIYVSNRNRDTHMDYSEFWGTENFESSLLTHNPNSRVPKIATPFWYQFFCLFFLGWAYTFWFNNICDTQEYTFIKELSYHPFNDEQVDNNVDPSMYMGGAYGFQFRGGSGAFVEPLT